MNSMTMDATRNCRSYIEMADGWRKMEKAEKIESNVDFQMFVWVFGLHVDMGELNVP
jgi:hypothetical protein